MSVIDTTDLKAVAKFVDGLNRLSESTGVTIYAAEGDAELRVFGEVVGIKLSDHDYAESGYGLSIDLA